VVSTKDLALCWGTPDTPHELHQFYVERGQEPACLICQLLEEVRALKARAREVP